MPDEKQILNLLMEKSLLRAIDDYRFANRIETRAEATRDLIRRALTAEGFPPAPE